MADQQDDSPKRPIRGWPLEIPSWLFPGAVVSGPGGKRRFWVDSLLCNRLAGEISVKVRAYHSCSGCCMDIDPHEVSRDGMVVELSEFLRVFEAVAGWPYSLSPTWPESHVQ